MGRVWTVIMGIISGFGRLVKNLVLLTFAFIFDTLFKIVDLIVPIRKIAGFIRKYLRWLWNFFISIPMVQRFISRNIFTRFGNATTPRPHPFTMAADYASWEGLFDKSYTARHLPINYDLDTNPLPEAHRIIELFMRGDDENDTGKQVDCPRSTLLFAAFAQWFTDSFLRTAHAFDFDKNGNVKTKDGAPVRLPGREQRNTSNHEIDLCQIYGLNAAQTKRLRLNSEADRGCLKFTATPNGEFPAFLLKHKPAKAGDPLTFQDAFTDIKGEEEHILRHIVKKAGGNDKGYETLFACGLEHGNSTIGNSLFNTIFLREHNRIARLIAANELHWNDEQVFQITRNVMIVLLMKVVVSDYIRHISPLDLPLQVITGIAEKQSWYRNNRIAIEFNLLYRWHDLVPDEFPFLPDPKNPMQFLHNNNWLLQTGLERLSAYFQKPRRAVSALAIHRVF